MAAGQISYNFISQGGYAKHLAVTFFKSVRNLSVVEPEL